MDPTAELLDDLEHEPVDIGARVAAIRRHASLTQRDMAQRLGITLWNLNRLETGIRSVKQLTPEAIVKLQAVIAESNDRELAGAVNDLVGAANGALTAAPPPPLAPRETNSFPRTPPPVAPEPGPIAEVAPEPGPIAEVAPEPVVAAAPAPPSEPEPVPEPVVAPAHPIPPLPRQRDWPGLALPVGGGVFALVLVVGLIALLTGGNQPENVATEVPTVPEPTVTATAAPEATPTNAGADPAVLDARAVSIETAQRAYTSELRRQRRQAGTVLARLPATTPIPSPAAIVTPAPIAKRKPRRPAARQPQRPASTSEPDEPGRIPPATFVRP